MKKLRAPPGTDEANYGTERYRVDNDGVVEVPDDAVQSLVDVGGFQEVVDVPVAPEGHVLMHSTIGPQSCSFEGRDYGTDADDCVTVPNTAVAALTSHGFEVAEQRPAVPVDNPVAPAPVLARAAAEEAPSPSPDPDEPPAAPALADEAPQA